MKTEDSRTLSRSAAARRRIFEDFDACTVKPHSEPVSPPLEEAELRRRDFLIGLGTWSKVVIGAALFGGLAAPGSDAQAASWVNRRGGGGGWVNGGGGGGWINRRGGGWINRR